MIPFVTLVGLSLRGLWISFRLLLIVTVLLGSVLALLVVTESVREARGAATYAVCLAAASAVAAAVAAHGVACDIRDGAAAWLAVRAVPRDFLVLAWLTALLLPLACALVPSALVAWLALAGDPRFDATGLQFALAITAVGVAAVAGVSLGVVVATVLPPWPAALVTLLLCALVSAAAYALPAGVPLPSGGVALLATLSSAERPVATALQSIGAGLVVIAGLAAVAAAILQRADL